MVIVNQAWSAYFLTFGVGWNVDRGSENLGVLVTVAAVAGVVFQLNALP